MRTTGPVGSSLVFSYEFRGNGTLRCMQREERKPYRTVYIVHPFNLIRIHSSQDEIKPTLVKPCCSRQFRAGDMAEWVERGDIIQCSDSTVCEIDTDKTEYCR